MNNIIIQKVKERFKEISSQPALMVRSPGRINFIGEHTDYNDGYVFPAAIDKAIYLAAGKSGNDEIHLVSLDLNDEVVLDIGTVGKTGKLWSDYLAGVTAEIQKAGYNLGGFTCVFSGDIPIGAGLSTSAAITCGLAYALNELFELKIPLKNLARFAQSAEHNFAGVNCGIMDQFINLFGEKDKVMLLDCRSLDYKLYPFEYPVDVILCNPGIKHSLASSEYNLRRRQCEEGASLIREKYSFVKNLRDVNIRILEEFETKMHAEVYSRCLYVIEENDRVLQAANYLINNNIAAFGGLLSVTHEGLRIDYEVSIPEIDTLVYAALDLPGVYGSRMMGGGFGGCTLNIVNKDKTRDFIQKIRILYKNMTGLDLEIYECSLGSGTSLV